MFITIFLVLLLVAALLAQVVGGAIGSVLPFLDCWARMRRVRGVVPLGMLMMYLPSISAVTRRRFTADVPVPSSAGRLITDAQDGKYMRVRQRWRRNKKGGGEWVGILWGKRNTGLTDIKENVIGRVRAVLQFNTTYQLWCFCFVVCLTRWQRGGCQVGGQEWPVGSHCLKHWLSCEWQLSRKSGTTNGCVNWFSNKNPVCLNEL